MRAPSTCARQSVRSRGSVVSVRVTGEARGYAGEVREVVNGKESAVRPVDGETCKDVVEALSLSVALSIDPDAHARSPDLRPRFRRPRHSRQRTVVTIQTFATIRTVATTRAITTSQTIVIVRTTRTITTSRGPGAAPLTNWRRRLRHAARFRCFQPRAGALSATVLRESNNNTSSSVQLAVLFTSMVSERARRTSRATRRGVAGCVPASAALRGRGAGALCVGVAGRARGDRARCFRRKNGWTAPGGAPGSTLSSRGCWGAAGSWMVRWAARCRWFAVAYFTNEARMSSQETPLISPLARLGLGFRF